MQDLLIVLLQEILHDRLKVLNDKTLVSKLLSKFINSTQALTNSEAMQEFIPILELFLGKTSAFRAYLQTAITKKAQINFNEQNLWRVKEYQF